MCFQNSPVPAKRRKCRPPTAEEEEMTAMDAAAAGAVWTPRPLNDLKISSIYNRSATEAPAEVSLNLVYLPCICCLTANFYGSWCESAENVACQSFVMFSFMRVTGPAIGIFRMCLLLLLGLVCTSCMEERTGGLKCDKL